MKHQTTIHYYAYFHGDEGQLTAFVYYNGIRKKFSTPVMVSREQLLFFNSDGIIEKDQLTKKDKQVNAQLATHKKFALQVIEPLVKHGLFKQTSGGSLRASILFAMINHNRKGGNNG